MESILVEVSVTDDGTIVLNTIPPLIHWFWKWLPYASLLVISLLVGAFGRSDD